MCGILGVVDLYDSSALQKKIITNMLNTLTHRGPDAQGMWTSNSAIICHRRLIVIDPVGGIQPMIKKKCGAPFVLSYNGELYNTSEIRNTLKSLGHNFDTNSDTEVLLESFLEWGPSCVLHLNGIFAFALWDDENKSLFLVRDRFGVKPLFYSLCNTSFIFASEIKAILAHPQMKAEVTCEGLAEIFVLGPSRTPGISVFKNIFEVKPGYYLQYDKDGIVSYKYWSLKSKIHTDDLNDTLYKTRFLVEDSIKRQLVSDVPVCTFLSGGLDSSLITAIAAKHYSESNLGTLNTFSIDYKDNDIHFTPSTFQPSPDSEWVKVVSDHFNTNHHYIYFDTPELVDSLSCALIAKDLPGMTDIDSSLWLFCREIRKSAVVALSGECADEIFGGYPWFNREDLLNLDTFPWIRSLDERLKVLSPDLIELINPYEYIKKRYMETLRDVPHLESENHLEKKRREIFYLNIVWFMQTLLDRKDRMSMAHGLEVRVPYCDHRLLEYVWNIPWNFKMLNGREKGLLRKAFEGVLPDSVLYRKKSPFPKTHNPTYEEAVKKWLSEIINNNNSPIMPLINIENLKSLLAAKSDYSKPWFGQLMAMPQLFAYLIQINIWLEKYNISII